jgi:acyl carrier protein
MDAELYALIEPKKNVYERLIGCLKENFNIPYPEELIHPDAPLFGSGLGLDSIDSLELIMVVENEFGISIDENDMPSMRTLNLLTDHILNSSEDVDEQ